MHNDTHIEQPGFFKKLILSRTFSAVLAVCVSTTIVMFLFELLKQYIDPNITLWESHVATIIFIVLVTVVLSHFILQFHVSAQEELADKKRLAAIAKVAGAQSHEIKGQLRIVKGLVDSIRQRPGSCDADSTTRLDLISKEIEDMEWSIDNALLFARAKGSDFREVNIKDVLLDAVNRAKRPEKVEVATSIDGVLPEVWADRTLILHAFYNIISNSIHAMGDEGKLTITADMSDGQVRLSFRDTSPGIKKEDKNKVFHPFFTVKFRGTGLGFLSSRTIIEEHGGKMSHESWIGKGTIVVVTLPVTRGGNRA